MITLRFSGHSFKAKVTKARQFHSQRFCRWLSIEIQQTGQFQQHAGLLVANHVSWLDILVLASIGEMCFVSKAEIRHWPLIGWVADKAHTLFIQRGQGATAAFAEQMSARIQAGETVAVFPEATTTNGQIVRPFYARLFATVSLAECPVQPVALRYLDEYREIDPSYGYVVGVTLLESVWHLLCQSRTRVCIDVLPAIPFAGQSRKTLAKAAQAAIATIVTDEASYAVNRSGDLDGPD